MIVLEKHACEWVVKLVGRLVPGAKDGDAGGVAVVGEAPKHNDGKELR